MSNSSNSGGTPEANFRVCVRIRPLNAKEDHQTTKKFQSVVKAQDNTVFVFDPNENSIRDILANNQSGNISSNVSAYSNPSFVQQSVNALPQKKPEKEFIFDDVFDETRSTEDVFAKAIHPAVDHILSGYNSTVFAYGMTGAGKTFTIFGNLYSQSNVEDGLAIKLLRALHNKAKESSVELTFKFSYLEIYNENIRDLMVQKSENLMVIEDPEKGVFVPDLTEYPLIDPMDINSFIIQGNTKRVMASTAANQFSSRSHAIIQISCEQRNHGEKLVVRSKLCIVDLAGSERAASTENRGMRLTEGANINRSLLALGNCINLLSDSNKKGSFVPYRDSKLTRLLKESLGGNTKSIMIACVSPSSLCYDETVNTLKYAMRARNIKKSVKKNTKEMSEHASEYLTIIQSLRSEITSLKDQLQLKNTENLQLKNNRQRIQQNSNYISVDQDDAASQQPAAVVDEICEKLFENLEEYWEIKNTIDEIIKLNEISSTHIADRVRLMDSGSLLTQISLDSCRSEIDKRREVIQSNQQILQEMNSKLIKNAESKKELLQRICSAGQQQQSYYQQSIYSTHDQEGEIDIITKDAQIAEMQQQMRLMQIQLDQKDVLLKQKSSIIRNLESTTNVSASVVVPSSKQRISHHSNTGIQLSSVNPTNQSSVVTSNPSDPPKPRKFFMKIPQDMINDRPSPQASTASASINLNATNKVQVCPTSADPPILPPRNQNSQKQPRQRSIRSDENPSIVAKKPQQSQQLPTAARENSRQPRQSSVSNNSNFMNANKRNKQSSLAPAPHQQTSKPTTKIPVQAKKSPEAPSLRTMEIQISELKPQFIKITEMDSNPSHFLSTPSQFDSTNSQSQSVSLGNYDLSWSQPSLQLADKVNMQLQDDRFSYNHNKRTSSVYQKQLVKQQQQSINNRLSQIEEQTDKVHEQISITPVLPPRDQETQNDKQLKSKASRSQSCFKLGGQDFELNSYALARKKVLEFKEKLSQAVEKPSNFNQSELMSIVKEYKSKESNRSHQPGKQSEDDVKIMFLESLLQQGGISSNNLLSGSTSGRETENIQPHIVVQQLQVMPKKLSSFHSAVEQNGYIVNKSTSLSYAQQQLRRKEQQNASSNGSQMAAPNTMPQTATLTNTNISQSSQQILKNTSTAASSFIPSSQSSYTQQQKTILPRGLLSQMNQNYADTVNYSQNAMTSVNQQPSSMASQRDRSPMSTKSRDTARSLVQDQLNIAHHNGSIGVVDASNNYAL